MEILLLVYNDKDKLLRVVIVLTIINMALQIFFLRNHLLKSR